MTIWRIDANATLGSVQSDAICPHHQEPEKESATAFHQLLLTWNMALPATFHHDPTGATTWTLRTGTTRRYDCSAMPRGVLPMVESAGVDRSLHLVIHLRLDHFLTQVTVHVPTVGQCELTKRSKQQWPRGHLWSYRRFVTQSSKICNKCHHHILLVQSMNMIVWLQIYSVSHSASTDLNPHECLQTMGYTRNWGALGSACNYEALSLRCQAPRAQGKIEISKIFNSQLYYYHSFIK